MAVLAAVGELVLNAVGDFDAFGPLSIYVARNPNADIGVAFVLAPEPGGD